MLVLSRRRHETILIGDEIAITVIRISPDAVRIGITAPKSLNIVRKELTEKPSPLMTTHSHGEND